MLADFDGAKTQTISGGARTRVKTQKFIFVSKL